MRLLSLTLLGLFGALALSPVHAESQYTTGNSTLTANARLDFQITIPKVLYLRVGTGTENAANATINQVAFSVPAANVGNGTAVAATAASGDLGNGVVTAKLVGNNGTVTLSASTVGALGNGSGDTISYSQILTSAATLTSATALPAPVLADGAGTALSIAPVSGKVVNRDARWTFTYSNSNVVAPGTYGGVNSNNSRVTYTASMP